MRANGAAEDGGWAELVARHDGRLRAVARSHKLQGHDVDDVVQTTWLRLIENSGAIRDPSAVGAWLATTASRTCLRVIERSGREVPAGDARDGREPAPEAIDDRVVAAERAAALAAALEQLSECQRALLGLTMREPAPSYAQIAYELGIPVGSIGPTRGRCLARLRQSPALASVG